MIPALVILFLSLIHPNDSIQQTRYLLQKVCDTIVYFSFKCPCGVDDKNKDHDVYKNRENEKHRIVGEKQDWRRQNFSCWECDNFNIIVRK